MLKRLAFAVTLAASTLLVTGTAQASAQTSDPSACASAQHITPGQPGQCLWRAGCYECYSYRTGRWETQHCD
ncbi:hypothetical protein Psi02_08250 [Planotetraspora silvatica]|uniref:Uncharacterized protein n=1 Tax=Planotetraspora silvatica TaxID=234614 RepID=A0A8J3UJF8_9ACTN|nr:hypothetical protein [Planotetraspora silvatica]GII44401.1 hypothetical protein Psi02_08250 [Planotetraspora silvatica]